MPVRIHTMTSILAGAALGLVLAVPATAAGSHAHGHMQPAEGHAGHMKSGAAAGPGSGPMSFGKPGDPEGADRVVDIVMEDNFFTPESISVRAGETIRFNVVNRGTLVHEFNLGTPSYHAAHQSEMMMMQEHGVLMGDHINHAMMNAPMGEDGHMMSHDHPNSVLLEPGKSGIVTWTFTSGGDIEFACNVPGHYAAGMVGTVDVE